MPLIFMIEYNRNNFKKITENLLYDWNEHAREYVQLLNRCIDIVYLVLETGVRNWLHGKAQHQAIAKNNCSIAIWEQVSTENVRPAHR